MKNIKTLKFWAEWCKPCTALSTQLEGLEMTSYNIDNPESAAALKKYQIRNIPALVFVEVTEVDGKEVETEIHRHLGIISRQAYLDTVDALTNEKINPEYQEYVANLGSPKTESIYTQVIDFNKSGVDSLSFICGEDRMFSIYGKLANNIEDFVSTLNSTERFSDYGTYYNNGDGRLRLEITLEQYEKLKEKCSNKELSLQAFLD